MTFPPSADTGRRGEQAAVDYLRRAGFAILERNWRSGRYELDIVARRWDELHFIEVKTRRAGGLTTPEEAITPRKFASLRRAAASRAARTAVRSGGGRSVSERVSERAFYGAGDGMQLVIWVLTQK